MRAARTDGAQVGGTRRPSGHATAASREHRTRAGRAAPRRAATRTATAPRRTRLAPIATIDFDWSWGGPALLAGRTDVFSVKWSGSLVIPATGTYTFRTTSDDGVRLLIDGVAVVDNWTEHSPADNDGAIALPAGAHTIEYRYYENGGGAVARLSWLIPGSAGYVVVPATALRTA